MRRMSAKIHRAGSISKRTGPAIQDTLRHFWHISLPAHAFFQADVAWVTDYEVIEQLYIEDMRSLHELLRHIDIFGGRGGIATRMVMAHDNVRTVAHDGGTEYFGRAQDRTIHRAFVAFHVFDHLIFGV